MTARPSLNELALFATVARARSFTAAAKLLGISPSAVSHSVRGLEERLGVRLLARTTRSVSPTDAGERLLATLLPALADIDAGVSALHEGRNTPAGTVRVTAVKHAVETLLLPRLPAFSSRFPDIRLEIDVDDEIIDLVERRFDVGIRFAGRVDKDMISIAVGPEIETTLVAAPSYLSTRPPPSHPRDLADHRCICHARADGSLYPWSLKVNGKVQQIRSTAALAFNDSELVLGAAVRGQGIACVFSDRAAPFVAAGALKILMPSSSVRSSGYALYYPTRRQIPPALSRFIEAMRSPLE